MATARQDKLQNDIEQACINSYVQDKKHPWTLVVTEQLRRFAMGVRDAIAKYDATPSFVFSGPVPVLGNQITGPREYTLTHGLGYTPIVNPVEKQEIINFVSTFRVSNSGQINRPEIIEITSTTVTVRAYIGDIIRVTVW